MTEAPEREVLFMPKPQTVEVTWRWEPDVALRWWAPAFNGEEHDMLRRTELDIAEWHAPSLGSTYVRLNTFQIGGWEISGATATGMTILRMLSYGRVVRSEQYHKQADALSPLSVLLRRLSIDDAIRFEHAMRDYARDKGVGLQVIRKKNFIYLQDGDFYTATPVMLFTQASLLLHALFLSAGHEVRNEGGYYHLADG